ncbi:MAG: leucine-rich repeat-containing protein kinase family protein [Cytophaga sp.]|uniref:leucine-rich repeat-containing protein kinase family protein n=1 Tax=Cytophaga sp. TaxID=29535 RepID=UPI003F820FF8
MHTLAQLKSGSLKNLTNIKLSEGLTVFPEEIFEHADTLEVLDLSGNELNTLPDTFYVLKKLKILFLSMNQFTVFPAVLKTLAHIDIIGFKANRIKTIPEESIPVNLRWLILTDNCIEALPVSIGACTKLQKVMLAGNCLQTLPDAMAACINIELLRISSNRISRLPDWLVTLPKLAWLAYSSNPCQSAITVNHTLESIPWQQLSIQEQLGEGASGIISKALWQARDTAAPKPVAVKIFKGAVTSDGLPEDEMQACLQAGSHDNLVKVLGIIDGHPFHKPGLVMELIDAGYVNLGGPPSFVTCTRDTFGADTQFTIEQIVRITKGIASAAQQLHARGIMHGDLYAHNILINADAHPLFGDFGAATVYDRKRPGIALLCEGIEVRAFGCLLDDLLQFVPAGSRLKDVLCMLRDTCMDRLIERRPDFKTITAQLEVL